MNQTTKQKEKSEQKAKSTPDEGRLTIVEKLISKIELEDKIKVENLNKIQKEITKRIAKTLIDLELRVNP